MTIAIFASGMVTPLGYNARSTLAALRAGISALRKTAWVDDESGEYLQGGKVELPQWSEGLGKLADLVAPAIHECLVAAGPEPPARVPLLIGVASHTRPARVPGLDRELLGEVEFRLGLPHHPSSLLLPRDQAGCVEALRIARQLIQQQQARRVVVAGVDSFLKQPMLDAYIDRRRVMTPSNSNGFFPAEAGAAVLVGGAGTHNGDELELRGLGLAQEEATIEATTPFKAAGLTRAMKLALAEAGVTLDDVAWRLTDLSAEHYKFKEASFAAARLSGGDRAVPLDLWHPIEYLGEIGAAILPCLLAQALHAASEGYASGPLALCHVGSDAGERAALVVGLRPRRRGGPRQQGEAR